MTCTHETLRALSGGTCPVCPPSAPVAHRGRARAVERKLLLASFPDYLAAAWHLVNPAHEYVPNTATTAIALHLDALASGKISKLAVAIPPGLAKTSAAVLWVSWVLARDPAHRFIYASYAHSVAQDACSKVRRVLESDWYRERFPQVRIREDQNRLDDIGTTAGGRLFGCGVGGALTSVRADTAIVDDSLNAIDAFSKAIREKANDWFDGALCSRIDGAIVRVVAIQQRLHSQDLIGHLAATRNYEMLVLPAEFEIERRCVTSIWSDPREEEGELLAPTILSAAKLEEHRARGSSIYSTQYQQNPVDAEGGLLRRELWSWYKPDGTSSGTRRPAGCSEDEAVTLPAKFDRVLISIDTAFKGNENSDYFVAIVAGLKGAQRFLLEMVRKKMNYGPAKQTVRDLAARYPGCTILVEDSASGTAIVSELGGEVRNLIAVPTGGRSKEERVQFASPAAESRQVYLPEGGVAWVEPFVTECAEFPRGANDDAPDAWAQLINYAGNSIDIRAKWRNLAGGTEEQRAKDARWAEVVMTHRRRRTR